MEMEVDKEPTGYTHTKEKQVSPRAQPKLTNSQGKGCKTNIKEKEQEDFLKINFCSFFLSFSFFLAKMSFSL